MGFVADMEEDFLEIDVFSPHYASFMCLVYSGLSGNNLHFVNVNKYLCRNWH